MSVKTGYSEGALINSVRKPAFVLLCLNNTIIDRLKAIIAERISKSLTRWRAIKILNNLSSIVICGYNVEEN
jgi:hypothetical protein